MKRYKAILCLAASTLLFQSAPVLAAYGVQTKIANCASNAVLPDSDCTSGAILTTDISVICKSGYTKTVRNVTTAEKKKVFAEYGIPYSQHSGYEVDHLISLELGGSNDISNLWPESYSIKNGSRTKDTFENYLHKQVCTGKMAIEEAQQEIATNWLQYSQTLSGKKQTASAAVTKSQPTTSPAQVSTPIKCNDGTFSTSKTTRGACSHHGGIDKR